MFNFAKMKRDRNYQVVKNALLAEKIDTVEQAERAIKLTFANGKNASIVAVLVFAILLILLSQYKTMILALGAIIFAWIWGSVFSGRKQIKRYIDEEIHGKQSTEAPTPERAKQQTEKAQKQVEEAFNKDANVEKTKEK